MKKKPRFFCDNCGAEVESGQKACPHCGRFFSSVRCPVCGFAGEDKLFINGCPACGYSTPPGKQTSQREQKTRVKRSVNWTFFLSILILLAIVAIFSYLITR
ncbi:MAG: zinc-ribbon domain-containing protein [Treponema sp.]|jgi:RNA polymerase subunit RPABC4/transcription elongation factor Spt4|nr:zinc-ribbon domain-containing protein [Treponema sp.]